MRRWVIPGIGALVLAVAIGAGALVWMGAGGGGASCDRAALADAARSGIAAADRAREDQVAIGMPSDCDDHDLEIVLPEVTRDWHTMPGGTLMRAARHDE